MKLKNLKFAALFLGICILPTAVFADEVTISEDISIEFTVGATVETLTLQNGTVNEIDITGASVHITTGSAVEYLLGPSYLSFGTGPICNTPGKTKIAIPANTSSFITPTHPTPTQEQYTNTCDGFVASGAATGGGSSGPSPASTTTTNTTPNTLTTAPDTIGLQKISFIDVPLSGNNSLTPVRANAVVDVAQIMKDKGVIRFTNIFYPTYKTSTDFAIRMALAIKGLSCGDNATVTTCRAAAISANLMQDNDLKSKNISRRDFYQLMINTGGFELVDEPYVKKSLISRDKSVPYADAQIFATARRAGIAKVYVGRKFNLALPLERSEAAQFADRTLNAVKRGKIR